MHFREKRHRRKKSCNQKIHQKNIFPIKKREGGGIKRIFTVNNTEIDLGLEFIQCTGKTKLASGMLLAPRLDFKARWLG